jgi:hypothetical protein
VTGSSGAGRRHASVLTPLPGVELRQVSTIDVVSRYGVLGAAARRPPALHVFQADVQNRLPFPLKPVQVDDGSEFIAEFEAIYQDQRIALFVFETMMWPR